MEDEEDRYINKMQDLRFVRWHPYSLDVIPPGGSKANGIKNLIAEAGIELEDCYAFGDNYNDVEMLQYVPNSAKSSKGHQHASVEVWLNFLPVMILPLLISVSFPLFTPFGFCFKLVSK